MEPAVVGEDVIDQTAEESNVGAGANGHILIAHGRGAREVGINVDELSAALPRHHGKTEADGMRFRHVRTHKEDAIGILHVLLKTSGRAATE